MEGRRVVAEEVREEGREEVFWISRRSVFIGEGRRRGSCRLGGRVVLGLLGFPRQRVEAGMEHDEVGVGGRGLNS